MRNLTEKGLVEIKFPTKQFNSIILATSSKKSVMICTSV